MSVRVATVEDCRALARLVAAFRDHLGAGGPTEEELLASLPRLLADETTEVCLAHGDSGEPVGYSHCRTFLSLWGSGLEAHLEDLFVLEAHRGQGIGEELLRFAMARVASRGAVAIGLHTNERNEGAQGFYLRNGFSPATEERWDGGREFYWVRVFEDPEKV